MASGISGASGALLSDSRQLGVASGLLAHLFWGVAVLFWPLLSYMSPTTILAQRMLWACGFTLLVLLVSRRQKEIYPVLKSKKTLLALFCGGMLLSLNWGVYIWAVNSAQVIDASLGYFITPLLNVLMGRVFLGERLSNAQKIAILLAVVSVSLGIIMYGQMPWLGLVLATSFALYGFLHKVISVDSVPALFLEMCMIMPFAIAWLITTEPGTYGILGYGVLHVLLLAGTIFCTGIPLLLFSYAARHINLATVGILQYVSPSISIFLAILVQHEPMKPSDYVTFPIIWLALALYTWDSARSMRAAQKVREGKSK